MKTNRRKKVAAATAPPAADPPPDPPSAPPPTRFEVHLGGAREVCLAGTFNDWQPASLPMVDLGQGRWSKELMLPPGTFEYLFVADGRWLPDPAAPSVPNPYGGSNSVVTVR
ncbi:MAG: glycogen-binding domain-containing protein [Verrucomicrobiota bacterium]